MPVFAHLAGVLEPLAFLPAFLAVVAAMFKSVRRRNGAIGDRSTGEP